MSYASGLITSGAYDYGARKNNNLQSAKMNAAQLHMYQKILLSLACASLKWENLPQEIDQRFLNMTLMNRGLSVFFFDDTYDKFFACSGTPSGKINMYDNPLAYLAYGADGFQRKLKAKECVPIWLNYLRTPEIDILSIYARRLADMDRTIDVNLINQKHPVFIIVPEAQRLTVENALKAYYGNEPAIIGADGTFNSADMQYLSSGAPYIADKLLVDKSKIWNEIMTLLGIDNSNTEKRERVNTKEVESNDGQMEMMRLTRLDALRQACDEINTKFGLDVWVDFNKDLSSANFEFANTIENFMEGGEE